MDFSTSAMPRLWISKASIAAKVIIRLGNTGDDDDEQEADREKLQSKKQRRFSESYSGLRKMWTS
jgi:hypothetical protein